MPSQIQLEFEIGTFHLPFFQLNSLRKVQIAAQVNHRCGNTQSNQPNTMRGYLPEGVSVLNECDLTGPVFSQDGFLILHTPVA